MDSVDIDAVVVGAGVIGLACARALAMHGLEVVVLEKNPAFGEEISARNSEVIHAGLYYPPDSLKARLCVAGRSALYEFCRSHGVDFHRCGKLIVSTTDVEDEALEGVRARAAANGAPLERLSARQASKLEPELAAVGALLSPETGIVDSHDLMLALLGDALDNGAALALNAPFVKAEALADGRMAVDVGGEAPMRLTARHVVFAAGLWSAECAARIEGLAPDLIPRLHFARGCYFSLNGETPFSRLIYPAPEKSGALGVHLTLDLNGRAKFGPDMDWLDARSPADILYTVDPGRAEAFYGAVRRYWPGLPDGALRPDYAGVRPKLNAPGEAAFDFRIDGPETHSLGAHAILHGVESPGLTSCLAVADEVARRILR